MLLRGEIIFRCNAKLIICLKDIINFFYYNDISYIDCSRSNRKYGRREKSQHTFV